MDEFVNARCAAQNRRVGESNSKVSRLVFTRVRKTYERLTLVSDKTECTHSKINFLFFPIVKGSEQLNDERVGDDSSYGPEGSV